ncbi:hypothetical protein MASR1M60_04800 [Rhodocyclaceae bacterium]
MVITPALAATPEAATSTLKVSQTQPEDANDPLRLWFAEQDKLLDDILLRLSRIENLVREIHALVTRLPSGLAATAPAPSASVTPEAPPAAVSLPKPGIQPPPRPAPTGILGFFDEWGNTLAGIGLLILMLMIGQRHRKKTAPQRPTTAVDAPAAEITPDFVLEPKPAAIAKLVPSTTLPTPLPEPVTPAATKPMPEHSSIQRAGAMEPSNGQADQALELADIMLSMGLGHGAAQTLTEQIRNEPKQALLHWLKLLEIYRQNGQQAEFEKSAEELRQHFNVQPEDWQVRPESLRSIEDYPHIATRMCELWGRPACLVYLQNLLADNRGGARSGFPQSVAEELLLLTAMLKARGIASDADAAIDR